MCTPHMLENGLLTLLPHGSGRKSWGQTRGERTPIPGLITHKNETQRKNEKQHVLYIVWIDPSISVIEQSFNSRVVDSRGQISGVVFVLNWLL